MLKQTLLDGGILKIEISRSKHFNAFTDAGFDDIFQSFSAVKCDPEVRVVVLTGGESKHFSAGLDLQDPAFVNISTSQVEIGRKTLAVHNLVKRWQNALNAIEDCDKPVIVGIHGACVGAAFELATACDIRVCSKDARFSMKEVDIGLAADLGGLQRLTKIIGCQSLVREICFTGRFVSADEAASYGIVSRVFENAEIMEKALMQMATVIAKKSPLAILSIKKTLNHARDHSVKEGLEFSVNWNATMLQSEDVMKSVNASLQKKTPKFARL